MPEVRAVLRRVAAEAAADAGVLLSPGPSGAWVVASSTVEPELRVGDDWAAPVLMADGDDPELVTEPGRVAVLVPDPVRQALGAEPSGILFAPLAGACSRIVLVWARKPPPGGAASDLAPAVARHVEGLAPLLDAQVEAHESVRRLQAAVATAIDQAVVVTVGGDGRPSINAAAARLLGLDTQSVDSAALTTAMRALQERATAPAAVEELIDRLHESPTLVVRDWVLGLNGSPSHLRVTTVPVDAATGHSRIWVFDDISAEIELLEKEQRAVQALSESEEHYRLLAENVSDVVMQGTADGTLTWMSPSVRTTLGWAPEDLLGRRIADYVHPSHLAEFAARRDRLLLGESAEYELPFRTADGDYRWVYIRGKPLLDADGNLVGRVAGLWDVQAAHDARGELERQERLATQALAASEERYRLLAEKISDFAVLFDVEGRVTWVSPSVTDNLGWTPDDLVGQTTQHIVLPDDWEGATAHQEPLLRGERVDFEVRLRTAGGDHRWVDVRATPFQDEHGRPLGLLAACWDNQGAHDAKEELERSEQRAAQALAESEQRYRLLAENVSDIVIMGAPDGTVTWASPSITVTLGWVPEDMVGRLVPEFVRADHLEVLRRAMEQVERGESATFDAPILTSEGGYRWMEVRGRLLFDDAGQVVGRVAALWDAQAAHEAKVELERGAQALAASERRYRVLAQNVTDVVVEATPEGVFTWVSPSIHAEMGWRPSELVGTAFPDLVHPDDLPIVEDVQRRLQGGEQASFEVRLSTASGEYRWMSIRVKPTLDDEGRLVACVGGWWDTQDSHEVVERLAESEARYRMLLENTNDVALQTREGVLQWVSPAVEKVTGYRAEDLVGATTMHLWHPDDVEAAIRMRDGTAGGSLGREVLRFRHADGRYRWMEITVRPTVDAEGRHGLVGLMHDVTERVQAQEAARASDERYRTVAENASDVVCQYRPDGTIEWIFGSTETFVGRSAEEMVGTSLMDYFVAEDWGDRDDIRARLGRGEAVQLLSRLRHADGGTRWVEVRAQAVVGPGGSLESLIGTMRDTQAEVEYREALAASERQARDLVDAYEAARDEAIRASTAKTAFLSRMSHELRTPLNAVLGFAQLLSLDPLTPEQVEAVQHIRSGGRHLLELINEIVDISRIEAGRLSLTIGTVDSPAVLADAVELVRPLAQQYGVVVAALVAASPVPDVHADRQRVTQVLLNLMSNAVKYNRAGGSVQVGCRTGGLGEVVFEVTDTGPGIPEALLPRLFEPFDRLGAERSNVEGTGIGLTLADALARAMGGRIEVTTELGAGSTFSLVLQAAPTASSSAGPAGAEPDATARRAAPHPLHRGQPDERDAHGAGRGPAARLAAAGGGRRHPRRRSGAARAARPRLPRPAPPGPVR